MYKVMLSLVLVIQLVGCATGNFEEKWREDEEVREEMREMRGEE
jgi:hypothetical protein